MAGQVVNLFVLVAIGVIIADMLARSDGTKALFNGISGLWKTSVQGMLGNNPT